MSITIEEIQKSEKEALLKSGFHEKALIVSQSKAQLKKSPDFWRKRWADECVLPPKFSFCEICELLLYENSIFSGSTRLSNNGSHQCPACLRYVGDCCVNYNALDWVEGHRHYRCKECGAGRAKSYLHPQT